MTDGIVEKDFWVCLTLDYLFYRSSLKGSFAFKGGISLSKVFGLIPRFSEDIDLILDWRVLGYTMEEPCAERSRTQQDKLNKEINMRTEQYLANEFMQEMKEDFSKELSDDFSIYIDDHDLQTIRFIYPQSFSDDSILQEIRLEIGALSAWTPVTRKPVTSYAAEQYMDKFTRPSTEILTVDAQRTFWEKITILHSEFHRPDYKQLSPRYSRHYYDVYCLGKSPVKESAYNDLALRERVVEFKKRFYYAGWSNYDTTRIGSLKLMPPDRNLAALKEDYARMSNMIIGEAPGFDEIMAFIRNMEAEINILR